MYLISSIFVFLLQIDFGSTCQSSCDCEDNLAICLSSSTITNNIPDQHKKKFRSDLQKQMLESDGIDSLEFYIDFQKIDRSCDNDYISKYVQGCCRIGASSKNLSMNVYRLDDVCWRFASKNISQSNDRLERINRTLIEFIEIFHEHLNRDESGAFSISTLVALLVPACVSILVLPFAILTVCCCCRRSARKSQQDENDRMEKGFQSLDHSQLPRKSITLTIGSSKTTATTIDAHHSTSDSNSQSKYISSSSSDTNSKPISHLLPQKSFYDHSEIYFKSILKQKSASTPDIRSVGSTDHDHLTLGQKSALRNLRKSLNRSISDEIIGNDNVQIIDLLDTSDVPDEFYAVYVDDPNENALANDPKY